MPERSELLRLLTDYRPTDPAEVRDRLQMLDLAAVALNPFDRRHYDPGHFTASGFVIHPRGDRVLLINHAKIGAWLQPGGHIDPDDASIPDAARREIAEETGVTQLASVSTGLVDIDIHVFPEREGQPEHRHFDLRFAFVAGSSALVTNDEVLDAKWMGLAEVSDLDSSVTRPISKLLGDLSSAP